MILYAWYTLRTVLKALCLHLVARAAGAMAHVMASHGQLASAGPHAPLILLESLFDRECCVRAAAISEMSHVRRDPAGMNTLQTIETL